MDDLEALAVRRFGKLSESERLLLYSASKGKTAVCGPNTDPTTANDWGSDRVIRAALIRWLCVDQEATKRVDGSGVRVSAARITDELDLSFATVPFPLVLEWSSLTDDTKLTGVKMVELCLNGSHSRCIMAEDAEVKGNLLLQNGFCADGEVRLIAAQIGSTLNCEGSSFSNSRGCSNAREETFIGKAIRADRIKVEGGVFFRNGFKAEGEVMLDGAHVGGDLSCGGGTFARRGEGHALSAENINVGGNVFLFNGFTSEGTIDLGNARIGGALNCMGGTFDRVILHSATVRGMFIWSRVRNPHSAQLELRNAAVGSFSDDEKSWPVRGNLRLDGFVYDRITGTPAEDTFGEEVSEEQLKEITESLGEEPVLDSPTDARTRLVWLARDNDFKPQPYRQLAKVLREMGDEEGSKQVLFEYESIARAQGRRRLVHSPVRWLLQCGEDVVSDATVGYGLYPERAFWWLCGFTVLGWIVHRRAQRAGAIAPKGESAYDKFRAQGVLPKSHPPFSPFIYSLENCVPLVKLGQDDNWEPDPNPQPRVPPAATGKLQRGINWLLDLVPNWAVSPKMLRRFRWFMIIVGWVLATYFVAGLTGIIKTN
jgi:hypothetical protein